jgi:hypothetical protein
MMHRYCVVNVETVSVYPEVTVMEAWFYMDSSGVHVAELRIY